MLVDYGTDVLLIGDYRYSARGDVCTIDGLANLKEALYRRFITNPGELQHRPDYGVGVYRYMNLPATPSNRQKLANAITMNVVREKRISKVNFARADWTMDVCMIEISVKVTGVSVEYQFEVVK